MANIDVQAEFQTGVKETVKAGLALAGGVTVAGALVAGGLWPLFGAYVAGNLAFPAIEGFVASLGGNALAGWVQQLGDRGIRRFLDGSKEQLVASIDHQLVSNDDFYANAQTLLEQLGAFSIALGELQGDSKEQISMLKKLTTEMQRLTHVHGLLHRRLFQEMQQQFQATSIENQNILKNNQDLKDRIDELQALIKIELEHAKAQAQKTYNFGDIQRVNIADVYNDASQTIHNFNRDYYAGPVTINPPPPNPDEPIDILDALFPHRGKIV